MTMPEDMSSFFAVWWRSRPMHLLQRTGMIALLMAFVAVPAFLETPRATLLARYRKAGFQALHADRPQVAELYFRRMGRLDPTDTEGRFGMALVADRLGNLPLAHRLMMGLAFGDTAYPLAHNWLAEQLLQQRGEELTEDEFWQVQRHLEIAAEDPTARLQAHALLGSLLLSRQEYHESIPHLAAVVDEKPELRIPLSRAYAAIGKNDDAKFEIERALSHFRSMNLVSPGDADVCLVRVQCEMMAGDLQTAERVLRRAITRFPEDSRFLNVLQELHLSACDHALSDEKLDLAIEHLNRALQLSPETPGVMERFALIAGSGDQAADKALASLRDVIADGRAVGSAHLAMGGVLLRRGRIRDAARHFELGLRHEPGSVALLNNLAWCLTQDANGDADRALELIDSALGRPGLRRNHRAEVLETRGQILVRMGRLAEAAVDLERALPHLTDANAAHRTLASVYHDLGESELAALHQRRSTERVAEGLPRTSRVLR